MYWDCYSWLFCCCCLGSAVVAVLSSGLSSSAGFVNKRCWPTSAPCPATPTGFCRLLIAAITVVVPVLTAALLLFKLLLLLLPLPLAAASLVQPLLPFTLTLLQRVFRLLVLTPLALADDCLTCVTTASYF